MEKKYNIGTNMRSIALFVIALLAATHTFAYPCPQMEGYEITCHAGHFRDLSADKQAQVKANHLTCFSPNEHGFSMGPAMPIFWFEARALNQNQSDIIALLSLNPRTDIAYDLDYQHGGQEQVGPEISDMCIPPSWRGKRLATPLVKHAVEEFKKMKPETPEVFLGVLESNVPALKAYQAAGFETMRVINFHGNLPAHIMRYTYAAEACPR
jgi:ribosomal protein S18 acetylase RimI-like enzyme